jgi:hypothetical protein
MGQALSFFLWFFLPFCFYYSLYLITQAEAPKRETGKPRQPGRRQRNAAD